MCCWPVWKPMWVHFRSNGEDLWWEGSNMCGNFSCCGAELQRDQNERVKPNYWAERSKVQKELLNPDHSCKRQLESRKVSGQCQPRRPRFAQGTPEVLQAASAVKWIITPFPFLRGLSQSQWDDWWQSDLTQILVMSYTTGNKFYIFIKKIFPTITLCWGII